MDRKLSFTVNQNNFGDIGELIDELHANGQRFVAIIDPGIPMGEPNGTYMVFEEGSELGIWINYTDSSDPLEGLILNDIEPN